MMEEDRYETALTDGWNNGNASSIDRVVDGKWNLALEESKWVEAILWVLEPMVQITPPSLPPKQ